MPSEILKKLTIRNYIAFALITMLVYAVYKGLNDPEIVSVALENPLITFIMGTFTSGVTTVLYFYFRKSQTKESVNTG